MNISEEIPYRFVMERVSVHQSILPASRSELFALLVEFPVRILTRRWCVAEEPEISHLGKPPFTALDIPSTVFLSFPGVPIAFPITF